MNTGEVVSLPRLHTGNRRRIEIHVPADTALALDHFCDTHGVNREGFIVDLIEDIVHGELVTAPKGAA